MSGVEIVQSSLTYRFSDGSTVQWDSSALPLSEFVRKVELQAIAYAPRAHPTGGADA